MCDKKNKKEGGKEASLNESLGKERKKRKPE